ncbi:DUF5068 domain-containing protein [Priestia megaterium]|nr:DUF5068 domain-containing protein [Priestia megaterium]
MNKKLILTGTLVSSLVVATACSNSNTASFKEDESKGKMKETPKEEIESKSSNEDTSREKSDIQRSKNGFLDSYLDENLKADKEIVYENKEPKNIDLDGFKFNIEEYQVVHITNVEDPADFGDREEGYVVTVKANVDNQSGGKAYFSHPDLIGQNEYDTHMTKLGFVIEGVLAPKMDSTVDDPAYYEDGEKQIGLFEYILDVEEYNKLQNTNAKLRVPFGARDKNRKEHLGEVHEIDFPLSPQN